MKTDRYIFNRYISSKVSLNNVSGSNLALVSRFRRRVEMSPSVHSQFYPAQKTCLSFQTPIRCRANNSQSITNHTRTSASIITLSSRATLTFDFTQEHRSSLEKVIANHFQMMTVKRLRPRNVMCDRPNTQNLKG